MGYHTSNDDFLSSTYIIYISPKEDTTTISTQSKHHKKKEIYHQWVNTNTTISDLMKILKKDGCQLLTSTTTAYNLLFKVYCKQKGEDESTTTTDNDILKATLKEFLTKELQNHTIEIERNRVFRKPLDFYYGNKEIIDYAIELDYGLNDRDNLNDYMYYRDSITYEQKKKKKNRKKKQPLPSFNREYQAIYQDIIRKNDFVQSSPPWHLDRIDQHSGSLNNQYIYLNTGDDVDIYIIDTGIRVTHVDFEGRAIFLVNTVGDGINTDGAGYNTHTPYIYIYIYLFT